jgi:hypothetical protein
MLLPSRDRYSHGYRRILQTKFALFLTHLNREYLSRELDHCPVNFLNARFALSIAGSTASALL